MSANPCRIQIHYWSATGNTKLAADLAAEALRSVGADVRTSDIRAGETEGISDADLWVVASPVYDFMPAQPVQDFLRSLSDLGGVRTAVLLTYADFCDRSPAILARLLRRAGAVPWDWTGLRCEDSWPIARRYVPYFCHFGAPGPEARAACREWWAAVPERLAGGARGRSFWRLPTPVTPLAVFYARRFIPRWFRIRVDLDRCVQCGRCVAQCPTGRMRIEAFPAPEGDCVGCYGCINTCPEQAIQSQLTQGAPPYRGPASE